MPVRNDRAKNARIMAQTKKKLHQSINLVESIFKAIAAADLMNLFPHPVE